MTLLIDVSQPEYSHHSKLWVASAAPDGVWFGGSLRLTASGKTEREARQALDKRIAEVIEALGAIDGETCD